MSGKGEVKECVTAAEIVVPCEELAQTLPFFLKDLGFRLDAIFPADDPSVAVVSGYGVCLRLERGAAGHPGVLRLLCDTPDRTSGNAECIAPNGTRIEFVEADPPMDIPDLEPEFVVNRLGGKPQWGPGRAGMGYRDLIASRLGGRFIASHIRIADGGPVPDNVHFHKVRFQMIFCYRGWVRVAYEDQGEPIVMQAGDCVLQPPEIRHRVLEASDGMEVIEIACPAEHVTRLDHELDLPTGLTLPQRDFGGQRFVFHVAAEADWSPWRLDGFEARDTGIGDATDGLGGVRVVRRRGTPDESACSHDAEFVFNVVLDGSMTLTAEGHGRHDLNAGDSFLVPAGVPHAFSEVSNEFELLEVALPAGFATTRI